MAKLTRVTSKIFGENADPNIAGDPEISQFGSGLAETFIGTSNVDEIQSLPAWGKGWIQAVTPTQQFPALSEMTGAMKVLSYQSAYNQQMGIPEWDDSTDYYTNSYVQVDGVIYKSLTDENIGNNPTEDTENWEEFKSGGGAGLPIGTIYPVVCSSSYVPNGALPCDGTEYTKGQFSEFWDNYLSGSREVEFNQPTLTSNGVFDGNSFAIKTDNLDAQAYKITTSEGYNCSAESSIQYIYLQLPHSCKLKSITVAKDIMPETQSLRMFIASSNMDGNYADTVNHTIEPNAISKTVNYEPQPNKKYIRLAFVLYQKTPGVEIVPVLIKNLKIHATYIEEGLQPLLNTCTYTQYQSDITTYGQCGKFAVDTTNNKFKVPTIKDGSYVTQALSNAELGKAYNESLPNITGAITNPDTGLRSGVSMTSTGALYVNKYGTYSYSGWSSSGGSDRYGLFMDASRANSIYKSGAKVQGNNIRLRYFVQVASGQINQSDMDWSAWASSLQGKMNADHTNDTKPYLKTTYVSGTSGYNIWSNGYCEQWGITTPSSSNTKSVSLVKKFSNTNYIVIFGNQYTTTANAVPVVKTSTKMSSSFDIIDSTVTTYYTYWKACGYLASGQY